MQAGFLDGEAYARGTTVYLQDRRLDMLPSLLSEHLCSLRAGVDRCAVTVLWTLNADLSVESIWFGRSVIRCAAATPVSTSYAAVFVPNPVVLEGTSDS